MSVKGATKSGRSVTATGKTNVSNVREIIENDGRYTIRDIVKAVGISLSSLHFILKRFFGFFFFFFFFFFFSFLFLTAKQKRVRVQTAKQNC